MLELFLYAAVFGTELHQSGPNSNIISVLGSYVVAEPYTSVPKRRQAAFANLSRDIRHPEQLAPFFAWMTRLLESPSSNFDWRVM